MANRSSRGSSSRARCRGWRARPPGHSSIGHSAQTYTSEAEIDLTRDRALEHHKLANRGAEIRSEAVKATIADLQARIAKLEQSGKIGPSLTDQLDQATRESLELKRTILNNEEAMQKVRDKYAADKARYKVLTTSKQ